MPANEVEFDPMERCVLDWLESHASKKDAVVTASDTHMIRELGLEADPAAFFSAKMRLVAAGVISLAVDAAGNAVIRLNMRERTCAFSKRYALLVVPLELMPEIIERTRAWRQEAFEPVREEAALPPPVIVPKPKPKPKQEPKPEPKPEKPASPPDPGKARNGYTPISPEQRRQQVQTRLGVRLLAPGPIRPPVKIA